jgi:hypothetical protein
LERWSSNFLSRLDAILRNVVVGKVKIYLGIHNMIDRKGFTTFDGQLEFILDMKCNWTNSLVLLFAGNTNFFSNWGPNEPNLNNSYAILDENGQFTTENFKVGRSVVCMKKIETSCRNVEIGISH